MTEEIVSVPDRRHWCGPNEYGMWVAYWDEPPGTVWRCGECGRTWVAYKDERDVGYMGVKWRREGWFARRRRERSR